MRRAATPPNPLLLHTAAALGLALALTSGCADDRDSDAFRGYTTNVTLGDDDGGPTCDPPTAIVDVVARRSLLDSSQVALSRLTMEGVLAGMATNAGLTPQPDLTHDQFIDTYNEGPGLGLGQNCDDELAFDGETGLNGYPLRCPLSEGDQIGNLDAWQPVAVVNRFDLAPSDGSNCGQARVVFASTDAWAFFTIFEAQIPNPDPSCGIDACEPVQRFWADLSPNPAKRAEELEAAFISGHPELQAEGFEPFMSQRNMTFGTGQIRTNNMNGGGWTLREYKAVSVSAPATKPDTKPGSKPGSKPGASTKPFVPDVLRVVQVPVAANPFGSLWNDTFVDDDGDPLPFAASCQDALVDTVKHLMVDDPNLMAVSVPPECLAAESPDQSVMDYGRRLLDGTPAKNDPNSLQARLAAEIERLVPGSALEPVHIANRAGFAGGCIGCHQRSDRRDLGNGITANAPLFLHTMNSTTTSCDGGDTPCFNISAPLREDFLPHRESVMETYLNSGPCCDAQTITPAAISEPIEPAATTLDEIDVAALMQAEAMQKSLAAPLTVSGASTQRSH